MKKRKGDRQRERDVARTEQIDLLQPTAPIPKRNIDPNWPKCVLCGGPHCQIHSSLLEGSAHEKCHNAWLKKIFGKKKRLKS